MTEAIQISATISQDTRDLLQRNVSAHGVEKAHLIETAVLHHLSTLNAIPTDLVIPPVILVSRTAGKRILDRTETPKPPTPAMRVLYQR